MTAKASISLTDAQAEYARDLIAQGRFPTLSAVLQRGLDLLRAETELEAAEIAALRALLDQRRDRQFVGVKAGRAQTERMIAAKKAGDGV